MVNCINLIIEMSPRFLLGRENVPCVAEAVNRSLKADCTDFTTEIFLTPYSDVYELIFRQTNYFSSVVSIQRNRTLLTFALKLLKKRIMIYWCKSRPSIHGYNYLVFSFKFQLCKIIIAIAIKSFSSKCETF